MRGRPPGIPHGMVPAGPEAAAFAEAVQQAASALAEAGVAATASLSPRRGGAGEHDFTVTTDDGQVYSVAIAWKAAYRGEFTSVIPA